MAAHDNQHVPNKSVAAAHEAERVVEAAFLAPKTDGWVYRLINKWWFEGFINVAIAINTVQLGLETDHQELGWLWLIFENAFAAIFLVELVCKLWALRCQYFSSRWHWLDFFLVITAVADCWILPTLINSSDLDSLSALRILRLLRLMRFVKLFRRFRQFVVVVESIVQAVESCVYVCIVLSMAIYVFAIFSVKTVGQGPVENYPGYTTDAAEIAAMDIMTNFNPHMSFGNMHRAMLTLLNMALLAEWTEVMTPMLYVQPLLVPIFVMFALFATLGIMNVIVGMICDSVLAQAKVNDAADEAIRRREKVALIQRVEDALQSIDANNDGRVDAEELMQAMNNDPAVIDLIEKAHLPEGFDAEEVIMMLDKDGDGWLSYSEFVRSFFRLIDGGDFQRLCLMQENVNTVKALVVRVLQSTADLNDRFQALEDRLLTHGGQGESVEVQAPAPRNVPEQSKDFAMAFTTGSSDASAGVQAHHWHEALASLKDVSNTIRLELSHLCLDAMPSRWKADPSASLQNISGANDSIAAGLRSKSLTRSSPSVLPRPPSSDSIEPGLGSVPQAGVSAWSHSCEHSPLPRPRDNPPSSNGLTHMLCQKSEHSCNR